MEITLLVYIETNLSLRINNKIYKHLMNKNDRCKCQKIFSHEVLNCCCEYSGHECICEKTDFKCCMKIGPKNCCDTPSGSFNKSCSCRSEMIEEEEPYSISREYLKTIYKCCCVKNGKKKCCCYDIKDDPCCCIVAGNDDCCCVHTKDENVADLVQSDTINDSLTNKNERSRTIEKTSVNCDSMEQEPTVITIDGSMHTVCSSDQSCCDSKDLRLSDLVEDIPDDFNNPSILTSTCLSSVKNKKEYTNVDDELVNELRSLKKSSLTRESYDVYIVNEEGKVNSFEMKHYINPDEESSTNSINNPKEELLNRQVHGICIKNKESRLNSNYQQKMKSILNKIKDQSLCNTSKEMEPTILEITEITMTNNDKTLEILNNVCDAEESKYSIDQNISNFCDNNDVVEGNSKGRTELPLHPIEIKTFSCDSDILNKDKNLPNRSTKSEIVENPYHEVLESAYYGEPISSNEGSVLLEQTYHTINTSSETSHESVSADTNESEEQQVLKDPIKFPFDEDMNNKIEDALLAQRSHSSETTQSININMGRRVEDISGLEVTTFEMNIHQDDLIGINETDSPSDEIIDKFISDRIYNTQNEKSGASEEKPVDSDKVKERLISQHKTGGPLNESTIKELKSIQKLEQQELENISTGVKENLSNNSQQKTSEVPKSSFLSSILGVFSPQDEELVENETEQFNKKENKTIDEKEPQEMSTEYFNKNSVMTETTWTPEQINSNDTVEESKLTNISESSVSCIASTKSIGNKVEIALRLTNDKNEDMKEDSSLNIENSTITFIEQDSDDISSCLGSVKRNNNVGKLVDYFEKLKKK